MPPMLINILGIIIVLGVLIFFHELGHFVAAKLVGVKVLVFSLGFGPRLFGFRRRDTDYRLSLIPLGGYVRMLGDNPLEKRTHHPGEFLSKSRPARFFILVMGTVFNIILAILFLTIALNSGIEIPAFLEKDPIIGAIAEQSPASKVDISPGDKVLAIDNRKVNNWEDLNLIINTSPRKALRLTLERQGKLIERTLTPEAIPPREIGYSGFIQPIPPLVNKLEPGFPAEKAGLKSGDLILKIDGSSINHFYDIHYFTRQTKDKALIFTIKRGEKILTFPIKPRRFYGAFRIGITAPQPTVIKKLNLFDAFKESLRRNYRMVFLTIDVIKSLVGRRMSLRTLSGPIDIARFSGIAARMGIIVLLEFIAAISLQLALFNLLPIPVLDGGHIFILLIEGIARKDISIKIKEKILQIGLAFLLILFIFVIYFDIVKNL